MIEVLVIPVVSLVAALCIIGLLAYSLERRRQNKKCCLIIKDQRKWIGIFLLALMVGCSNADTEPSSVSGAEDSKAIQFPSFPSVFSPVATKPTPTVSTTTTTTSTKVKREYGDYFGVYNGGRSHFYFGKKMSQYPSSFKLTVVGCFSGKVIRNNGSRYEGSGGLVVKQSEVSGRGMAVVAPYSCSSNKAYIE